MVPSGTGSVFCSRCHSVYLSSCEFVSQAVKHNCDYRGQAVLTFKRSCSSLRQAPRLASLAPHPQQDSPAIKVRNCDAHFLSTGFEHTLKPLVQKSPSV